MKDKNRKLFHSLLDRVLEKQDSEADTGIDMNVSTLGCTASVWLMNVEDKKSLERRNTIPALVMGRG